jgi:hypothetical protein
MRLSDKSIDYRSFDHEFNSLMTAIPNLLYREWSKKYDAVDSARIIFTVRFQVAVTAYHAILSLCSDTPDLPNRKFLSLATGPLVRSLFEELIALIFLLHDVPTYIRLLARSGYREKADEVAHYEKYPQPGQEWDEYIDGIKKQMSVEANHLKLTHNERKNAVNTIPKWHTPKGFLDRLRDDFPTSPAIEFIEYISSWMYRKLSGDTHLTYKGLMDRGVYFAQNEIKAKFPTDYKEILENKLQEYKTEMMWTTFTLMLSMATEIEGHFKYGRNFAALQLWNKFTPASDIAKDFFEKRYSNLL